MPFVAITKPTIGEPTKKSLADLIVDDLTDLNARVSSFASAAIANGSFEFDADTDGIPDGWTRTLYSGGSAAINTSNHVSGDQSYSFTSTVLANGGGDLVQTDFSVVAGGKYFHANVWCRGSVANISSSAEIRWYDSAQSFISASAIYSSTNTPTTFTNNALSVQAPATARFSKIKLVGGIPGAGSAVGTIYFDALVFDELPSSTGRVTETMMESAAISISKLKSTFGDVSSPTSNFTAPGGNYGFIPAIQAGTGETLNQGLTSINNAGPTVLLNYQQVGGGSSYVRQYYIQASPPYDLGDGSIPLFVFAEVKPTGKIVSVYVAPEAPWHNNGPTNIHAERYDSVTGRGYRRVKQIIAEFGSIKAALATGLTRAQIARRLVEDPLEEIEITQAIKNADMPLIPHPFLGKSLGNTIVLIDPVSQFCDELFRFHQFGDLDESVAWLLMSDDVVLDNVLLNRARPPGVQVVAARWKLTP